MFPFSKSLENIFLPLGTPDEMILEAAGDADYMGADTVAKISGSLIMSMPNLKLIHVQGVGYNGVDLEAATSRGIMVCNNKGVNADSTAETAILLILGLLPCTQGEIRVDAVPVGKETLKEIREKIGFVLQNSDNQMFMPTVYEDMMG